VDHSFECPGFTAADRDADQRGLSFAEVVAVATTSHQKQENHDG